MNYHLKNHSSCDPRTKAYKNGKTFEECKSEARALVLKMANEIPANKEITWGQILETANHDEIVYKLILKYFREMDYDIGNYTRPRVIKNNA